MRIEAVHQFHPGCSVGDGVTNGMLFAQRLLRELGFHSEIYCERIPPALAAGIRPLPELELNFSTLLLVHHSLGYENGAWLDAVETPRVLVYHNITPAHLLPENSEIGRASELGRAQLLRWAPAYLGAIGDSDTNSAELRAAHYANVVTIPLLVDVDKIRHASWDPQVLAPLRDAINLLFVGRICANKRQLQLIDLFHEFLRVSDQPARLILVGATTSPDYRQRIEARVGELGLSDKVMLTGQVADAALLALYRCADAFVCVSEHEGFGMPLIEATLFDVPVLAYAASSIPGTLGEGGLLSESDDPQAMAEQLQQLLSEPALRRRVIAAQRRNLGRFAAGRLRGELATYLAQLGIASPRPPAAVPGIEHHEYWQIEGPFDSSYSLAVVNRELACALKARGRDVGLRSMEGTGDFAPSPEFLEGHPDCAAMAQRASAAAPAPDVTLRFCYPPHVSDMLGQIKVLHSYGWEESGFPEEYAAAFNRRLDLITVLSRSVEKILRDAGVRLPIAVTGAGVDHLLKVQPQPPVELRSEARGFRFLHISSCFPRKGIDALLWAYGQAFRRQDDVSLVLKTFPNPHNDVAQQLVRFRQLDVDYPHVLLINRDCSDEELVGLYQSCHAFVAPSRGEGFGLPMAEAMLFGLPVITTAWGGQTDFCDETTAWLCDYLFAKARSHFELSHSVWADPDIDHLAQLLREVYRLPAAARSQRTTAARQRVLRDYTWDRVAQANEQAISALAEQPLLRRKPRIGWISTWNKRCGIATYSSFLSTAIPTDRLNIFADRAAECTAPDEPNVLRCWNLGFDESLDETFAAIVTRGIEAVVIQYNFGFYSLEALARLIERLKQARIAVHCFFHATGDLLVLGQPASLASIAGSLAKADRLYVHSLLDLNRLKKFGLADNAVFFPHGLLPTPSASGEGERVRLGLQGKRILASYGFLLPHKGLRQLIQAFAQLAAADDSLHLLLVNALYPIAESEQERQACLALIDNLQVASRVTLISDFLPDAQCLALLQLAELIVFPYQRTQESASGAVRIGIASGRPVAVTPLSIFDDVADALHILPGINVGDIADGIRELLAEPDSMARQAVKTGRWVRSRLWPKLSMRLLNIIDGIAAAPLQ